MSRIGKERFVLASVEEMRMGLPILQSAAPSSVGENRFALFKPCAQKAGE